MTAPAYAPPVEAGHSPTHVYYAPGLDYPAPVAEAIAAYAAAHAAHTAEYVALLDLIAAVPVAEAEDAAALTASARAGGKVDPGGRADRARRTADAQAVRTADARVKATTTTDRLRAALDAHGEHLTGPVLAGIRAAADNYEDVIDRARRDVGAAARALQDAGASVRMLTPALRRAGLQTAPDLEVPPATPAWPARPTAALLASLDTLERRLTADTTRGPAA